MFFCQVTLLNLQFVQLFNLYTKQFDSRKRYGTSTEVYDQHAYRQVMNSNTNHFFGHWSIVVLYQQQRRQFFFITDVITDVITDQLSSLLNHSQAKKVTAPNVYYLVVILFSSTLLCTGGSSSVRWPHQYCRIRATCYSTSTCT